MRKMGKALGLFGLLFLVAWLLIQLAPRRANLVGKVYRVPAMTRYLAAVPSPVDRAPLAALDIPGSSKETKPTPGLKSTGTPSSAKPKIARFALPPGLNAAALAAIVKKCAQEQGMDEDLVWAVIRQESGGNPRAVSPKGAMGLMQLMPGTAAALGVTDPYDPEQNVSGGIKYLLACLNRFQQDIRLALAAYNAGPGNVIKYNGCPPFPETRNYVKAVIHVYTRQWRPPGVDDADASLSSPGQGSGLSWRVPLAKWKIDLPQVKISSPRWKIKQRPS